MFNKLRREPRQCRRSSLHIVDIHQTRINIIFFAQGRNAVSQLGHKFNTTEACSADYKVDMLLGIIFIFIFGKLIFDVFADQPYRIDAADGQRIFIKPWNAESLRLAAEGNYEIIIRQSTVFKDHFLLLGADFLHGRFHEVNLKFVY
ncbi:hypothetical protein D3C73_1137430 [compost metagenome]